MLGHCPGDKCVWCGRKMILGLSDRIEGRNARMNIGVWLFKLEMLGLSRLRGHRTSLWLELNVPYFHT